MEALRLLLSLSPSAPDSWLLAPLPEPEGTAWSGSVSASLLPGPATVSSSAPGAEGVSAVLAWSSSSVKRNPEVSLSLENL